MMRSQTTIVSLRAGTLRGSLSLTRAPKYLQFVMIGNDWTTLDALDQPDDEPRPDERVYAAIQTGSGNVHLSCRDKNGRRYGRYETTATYKLLEHQPDQDILRDTAKWQEWATEQHRRDCDGEGEIEGSVDEPYWPVQLPSGRYLDGRYLAGLLALIPDGVAYIRESGDTVVLLGKRWAIVQQMFNKDSTPDKWASQGIEFREPVDLGTICAL